MGLLSIGGAIIGGIGGFFAGGGPAGAAAGAAIGSSIGAGAEASSAAEEAAEIQAESTEAGIAELRRQFDITQENLAPFQEAGELALEKQKALLGLGTKFEQDVALAEFEESPGQQFLRDQQEKALLRNAAAIGGLGGGNIRTALQEQAFGRAQTDFANELNRLAGISGTGQVAATTTGELGSTTAGNIAELGIAGGEARASGILGQQQTQAQTIKDIISLGAQFGAFG